MTHRVIPPGNAVGVLGSGRPRLLFGSAERRMAYRIRTLRPNINTMTGPFENLDEDLLP